MGIEIINTGDGSRSLLVSELNETYHSTHGALTESQYVFIDKGIAAYLESNPCNSINVLEIGFGTGLNALLTAKYALHNKVMITYHTLETNPLDDTITNELNYHELIDEPDTEELFMRLHSGKWDEEHKINPYFRLKKIHKKVQEYQPANHLFEVIYFDAFAPSRQPEMWDLSIFRNLYLATRDKGILTTYCAQGQFKRDLKSSGFEVETLPGPPGKKEMTRGTKIGG